MTANPDLLNAERIIFLNRAQVAFVALTDTDLVITTTLGSRITVVGGRRELEEFAEELAKNAEEKFIPIPSSLWAMTARENRSDNSK